MQINVRVIQPEDDDVYCRTDIARYMSGDTEYLLYSWFILVEVVCDTIEQYDNTRDYYDYSIYTTLDFGVTPPPNEKYKPYSAIGSYRGNDDPANLIARRYYGVRVGFAAIQHHFHLKLKNENVSTSEIDESNSYIIDRIVTAPSYLAAERPIAVPNMYYLKDRLYFEITNGEHALDLYVQPFTVQLDGSLIINEPFFLNENVISNNYNLSIKKEYLPTDKMSKIFIFDSCGSVIIKMDVDPNNFGSDVPEMSMSVSEADSAGNVTVAINYDKLFPEQSIFVYDEDIPSYVTDQWKATLWTNLLSALLLPVNVVETETHYDGVFVATIDASVASRYSRGTTVISMSAIFRLFPDEDSTEFKLPNVILYRNTNMFNWYTDKIKLQPFDVKASEWNRLQDHVCLNYDMWEADHPSFIRPTSGDIFTPSFMLDMLAAIDTGYGGGQFKSAYNTGVSASGRILYASNFEWLKNAVNSVLFSGQVFYDNMHDSLIEAAINYLGSIEYIIGKRLESDEYTYMYLFGAGDPPKVENINWTTRLYADPGRMYYIIKLTRSCVYLFHANGTIDIEGYIISLNNYSDERFANFIPKEPSGDLYPLMTEFITT